MTRFAVLATSFLIWTVAPARADDGAAAGDPGARTPEPQVLVSPGTRHGGWGGPTVTYTTVRGREAFLAGGRGGWILDSRLTIGGGGAGLVGEIPAPRALQPESGRYDLGFGYGGLWLEYTVRPLRLVHLSFGALVGGGGVKLVHHDGGDVGGRDDGFFVVEPSAAIELNLARAVRADLLVSYRFTSGVELGGVLDDGDLSGGGFGAVLKFGSF